MGNTVCQTFKDAAQFGFLPGESGLHNADALQQAFDEGGTITISKPGIYDLAHTVYIGSHTALCCGQGVHIRKVNEVKPFTHVILNKGALTKTYDEHICISNLSIIVNGIDVRTFEEVFGLHGQLAFFYIKDLQIEGFRCMDLGAAQYGIHICTFEDIKIYDTIVKGDKDGIHLGRGKRFHISQAVFETYDDAVALNAHDYDVGNPELGWIEDGVVEQCYDLDADKTTGYFCRILAGAWKDWEPGMVLQKSDTVVANNRLYRVNAPADGTQYVSHQAPSHPQGTAIVDGISWVMVQEDVTYTAGVRNVIFRDIFLNKGRIGFSVHFDNDRYSRSYYPGASVPSQEQLTFENIRVRHQEEMPLLSIGTPMDMITIAYASLANNSIHFHGNEAMKDYLQTQINMIGCMFTYPKEMVLLKNKVTGKKITLKMTASMALHETFKPIVEEGDGILTCHSDLVCIKK